jgi:trk system potassium uptake protein TrkH
VTGLVLYDTWSQFTFFGQVVILSLIQIGGLGFMTIAIEFSLAAGRKIGLRERSLLSEAVGAQQLGGIVRYVRRILKGTVLIELLGAAIMATRFIPAFGIRRGIWFSVFHSVSAFCNAGFDLLGVVEPSGSLTHFANDPVITVTIAMLILIGGIGFLVLNDVYENGLHMKKLTLHSQVVISATLWITLIASLIFLGLEYNNVLSGMPLWEKISNVFFMAVTPRTAGFNTVSISAMRESSLMLTMILMFIGASPGGTGGGVKTTTIVAAIAVVAASINGKEDVTIRHFRISGEAQRQAFSALGLYIVQTTAAVMILCTQGNSFRDSVFECLSAIGTVGLTVGITPSLLPLSKIAIILLMYMGRIGSLAVFTAFTRQRIIGRIREPIGGIIIG